MPDKAQLVRQALLDPSKVQDFGRRHKGRSPTTVSWQLSIDSSPSSHPFPKAHYLDLRCQQNQAFADEQLKIGIAHAEAGRTALAAAAYKRGLDLVADHVDLLVADAARQANGGERRAALAQLERALEIEPEYVNAKRYHEEITAHVGTHERPSGLAAKSDRALQDALLEAGLSQGSSLVSNKLVSSRYELLPSEDEEGGRGRRKHKRKKPRSRRDSSSSSDEVSSDTEDRRRRRKRRRRKKKRRKEGRTSTASLDDESSVENSRHRRKKHRRRQSRSSSARDDDDGSKQHSKRRRRKDAESEANTNGNGKRSPPSDGTIDSLIILREKRRLSQGSAAAT